MEDGLGVDVYRGHVARFELVPEVKFRFHRINFTRRHAVPEEDASVTLGHHDLAVG